MPTFYHYGSWPVPVGCHSVFVTRETVARKVPGGVHIFERRHRPTRQDDELYLLNETSAEPLERLLAALATDGLKAGEDLAVVDPINGPIIECPSLAFWKDEYDGSWHVNIARRRNQPEQEPPEVLDGFTPVAITRTGQFMPFLDDQEVGLALAHRISAGETRSRDEYLCVFRGPSGYVLNVYHYPWLGEVPAEWYNEDGVLLPEHRDAYDDLSLPDEWNGQVVAAHLYGGFVGRLQPVLTDVQVSELAEENVLAALAELGWPVGDIDHIREGLQELVDTDEALEAHYGEVDPKPAEDFIDPIWYETSPLRIGFYSVIIKADAMERSVPGGRAAFEAHFGATDRNRDLTLLRRMSTEDVGWLLDELHEQGLVPGQDVAVADMTHGPMLGCPGLVFSSKGDLLNTQWFVAADEGAEAPAGNSWRWIPP